MTKTSFIILITFAFALWVGHIEAQQPAFEPTGAGVVIISPVSPISPIYFPILYGASRVGIE